jgi:hypothetical protein
MLADFTSPFTRSHGMKKSALIVGVGALLLSAALVAGPMAGHPNLKAAHNKILMAIQAMERAQKANDYDMGGHAAKAESLLRQAEGEIRMAAEDANAAGH